MNKKSPRANEKKQWEWNADTWISFCAVIIALLSIGLTLWEGFENREHNRLSVRPKLHLSYFYNEEEVGLTMGSMGLGPAILKWFEVKVNGKPQKDWNDAAKTLGMDTSKEGFYFKVPTEGDVLQPGTSSVIFKVQSKSDQGQILKLFLDNIEMRACFCSMYEGECFVTTNTVGSVNVPASCNEVPKVRFGLPPRTVVIQTPLKIIK